MQRLAWHDMNDNLWAYKWVSFADPKFACLRKGLFLCEDCAQVHTSFGSTASRIKSLNFGNWNEENLQVT